MEENMDGINDLLDIDRRVLVHPLHHPDDHQAPFFIERGEGCELIGADGRRVVDGLSGLWNVNIGHGRGELADAAAAQMRKIGFASAYVGQTNEPAIRLAEKIISHAYANSSAVYFTTAGAESNESAFKFARYYWKVNDKPDKTKIISRWHAYHGVTMAAMSATGMAVYHKMFGPLVPGFIQVAPPYAYRWQGNEEPGLGAAAAVEPDIVSFAKGVTSGYLPLGGIILSKQVHDAILEAPLDRRYMHAATYSGHPVCCAVGLRNVEIIDGEGLVDRSAVMGRRLLDGLKSELGDLPNVGDIRGLGMMCGIELVADKGTKAPALGVGVKVSREAMSRGLLARARPGSAEPPVGDTICLSPPLATPDDILDRI